METSAKTGFNAQEMFIEAAKVLYTDYLKYNKNVNKTLTLYRMGNQSLIFKIWKTLQIKTWRLLLKRNVVNVLKLNR